MIRNRDVVTIKERVESATIREKPNSVDVVQNTIIGGGYGGRFPTNEEVIAYVFGGG